MSESKTLHPAEVTKLEAETAKALAEADAAKALARKHEADAREAEVQARMDEISLEKQEHERKARLAGNEYHHVYYFNSGVSSSSVNEALRKLTEWHRLDEEAGELRDIEIIFNSPGGSVIDGMALFDFIQYLRRAGHRVTTGTLGYAASMGGILLQAGDVRWMGKEAYVLIHEISAGTGGKIGEMKDDVKFYEKMCSRVVDIFLDRADGKITKKRFTDSWARTDWWLDSDECLKNGFVDEVR